MKIKIMYIFVGLVVFFVIATILTPVLSGNPIDMVVSAGYATMVIVIGLYIGKHLKAREMPEFKT